MRIAILDGLRIPFQPSGTLYRNLMPYEMVNACFSGLLKRNQEAENHIEDVSVGTVMQDVKTTNIARECGIHQKLSPSIPMQTITQACISSSRALCSSAESILASQSQISLIGGVETFSDLPIRYSKKMRQYFISAPKMIKGGTHNVVRETLKLNIRDLKPELPAIANFTTGELMGETSEKIASRFGISRTDQDEFTLLSHKNAANAHNNGFYNAEVLEFKGTSFENNIRDDLKLSQLSKLRPSFRKDGTHTAANSSGLTDGATACIISSEYKARQLGLKPIGFLKSWVFTGADPFNEMLLGPAYAIPKLLAKNNLNLKDIDVFEIHEAFAGQILANLRAMEENGHGTVPMEKLNLWGGSLAIGHPLGATNIRNIVTACNRLKHEDGKYALVAACADGGLASALLIEKA
jgi:acetyl-CoA acyltransferase